MKLDLIISVIIITVCALITGLIWYDKTECAKAGGVYLKQAFGFPVCVIPGKGIV